MEKWRKTQNSGMQNASKSLLKATVYALNALENAEPFIKEETSYAFAMYANEMDESFKNYCCEMKNAILQVVKEVKMVYNTGRKLAIMENTINTMYDEVAKYNASQKSICAKYGTYIDTEKYKLTIQQRADKVEEFLKKDFNTTEYHRNIYLLIDKTAELLK